MSFEIPELPTPELDTPSDNVEELQDESGGCRTYAFIGSGQGGGRLVESLYKLGYKKALVCNTAPQDLKGLSFIPEDQKIQLDAGTEGAGKNMRAGESAASKGQHRIYEAMRRKFGKVDHIFICVGSGGGSGGGSSLVLLETAKKYMAYIGEDSKGQVIENTDQKVGFIVTLPTNGECASPGVATNAKFVVEKLADYANKRLLSPLIIVDNDKIKKLYPQVTGKEYWNSVNGTVAGLFHTFNLFPRKETNYTVFDSADYGSIMESGGCMIFGLTSVKDYSKADSISLSLRTNLEKTLLADGFDLRTATHAAAVVLGGSPIFEQVPGLMNSIEEGFDALAVLTGDALVHRGVYEDDKSIRLMVYTMVGGLAAPEKRINQIARFQGVNSDETAKSTMPAPRFGKSKIYDE
jgi:cell division GTPase FtsZ